MSVQHSPNVNEARSTSVNCIVQKETKLKFLPFYFKRFLRAAKFTEVNAKQLDFKDR